MRRRPVRFFSDGLSLDGDLYLPADIEPGERRPGLIACSGYQGLKEIHPARFARAFADKGFVCLAFEYRGFGRSEGQRGRLVPQEQIEDVRAAVSFLETVPEIDAHRIALLGWALGGGVAIGAAADDPRVRAVATVNAIGDGERSTRFLHDGDSWERLLEQVAADRRTRALEGASALVQPFEVVRLDEITREYVDEELYKAPGFGSSVSLEATDLLLRFRPERVVDRIAPRPLLLVHSADNRLYPPSESEELFRRAQEPKQLVLLEGSGHTEWMFDDHPTFQRLVSILASFLSDAFEVSLA